MTDKRISQFTPDAQRRIADAVRRVERSALRATGQWADVPDPFNRVIRWGRTTTSYEYPTYPTTGGVYVVEMGEYQPDTLIPGDTPDTTFTPYDPAWTEIAVDPTGATISQGTVVRVELHDGQWWIRPSAAGLPTCTLYQFEGYKDTGVSTGTTLAWSDTVKIACFPQRSLGDVAGCGLSIVTSPSAYTDYAFTTTTGGLYLIQFIAHPIDNTSYGGLYVTRTDSGGDTVNVPHGYWSTRTTIRVQYRASGGGEGDWIDAAYANGTPYILPSDGMTQYPRYAAVFASGIASIDADSEFCVRMLSSLLAQTGGSGQPTASACVFNAGNTVDTMNVRITRLGDTETEVSY